MSRYRRSLIPGATYFFTLALADRESSLLVTEALRFREAYRHVLKQRPVRTLALALMPDHIHAIWEMPPEDADYSVRWGLIKSRFSRGLPVVSQRSASQVAHRDAGIWQRRFWEHRIRDEKDLDKHVAYVHFNAVKHGLVQRVGDWPFSSFHHYVRTGYLSADWQADDVETEGLGE